MRPSDKLKALSNHARSVALDLLIDQVSLVTLTDVSYVLDAEWQAHDWLKMLSGMPTDTVSDLTPMDVVIKMAKEDLIAWLAE